MPNIRRIAFPWNYVVALLATAAAFACRFAFFAGERPLLILFILPPAIAAYVGGLGAGLFSSAITAVAARYLLLAPLHSFAVPNGIEAAQWAIYCVSAVVVSWGMDASYRWGRRADAAEHRAREVAAHAHAAEALRTSDERLRAMFEGAAVGIVEVDAEDRFVAVNGRFCEMLGYAREELLGKSLHEITAPEDREITRELNAKAHSGEARMFEYEKRYLRRDGTPLWVRVNVAIVRDEAGRFLRAVGTAEDVTLRRAAEESQARLAAIVESSDDAIVLKDLDGVIRSWNRGAGTLFGYAAAEAIGRPISILLPADRPREEEDILARLRRGERVEHYETKRLRKDGTVVDVSVTASPVRDDHGNLLGASTIARDITERKRAEATIATALQEAEEDRRRLAAVLDALPAGVVITDANGGFTHVNAELERIWGGPPRPRSTGEYREWRGWWPDTGRRIATEEWALARALSTGEVIVPGDVVDIDKFDGSGRATIVNAAAPIRNAEGEIVGAVLAEVDITAQKRAEAAARDAERRIRAVVEHLPSGLVVAELATGHLHWNAEALRIHGYRGDGDEHKFLESLVAEHDLTTLTGDPIPVDRWPLPALLRGESFREYEVRVHNVRLGWERVFSYSGVIIAASDGAPAVGLLAIVDVTDRSRAEHALREREEKVRQYAELVEQAPVLVRDLASRIVIWSRGMEKLYGWTRDEVLGKVSHDVLETRFPRPLPEIMAAAMRDGRWEGELVHRRRDGSELVVASSWLVHRDARGEANALIEVNSNITELKRAQAALSDEARRKDEFLGMLSHELRNPLAPIRNALYILERAEAHGEKAARAKEIANRQIAHLTRLVDDLLDVTRIARGKIELRCADLDVGALARRTAEDFRVVMHDRHLELEVRVPDEPVVVHADETRLAQVLGNLLHNAAKFTPSGGRVTLAVHAAAGRASIHVLDTGPGIAADVLPTIFEPFTQAKQTLARSEGGLGLGLALVKGLVRLHDGDVTASSAGSGRGTEFVVTLPLAAEAAAEEGARAAPPSADVQPRRVLVIDDNRDAAETVAELARMLGHDVEVAFDGYDGLAKVVEEVPDVVLCDIGLPGMDGYEFARQIRALTAKRRVRLVALSGYASPDDVAKAAEAGFDLHLAKPASPERIGQVLGSSGHDPAPESATAA